VKKIQTTQRRRTIAPLRLSKSLPSPDFVGRLKQIYGGKVMSVSGVDLLAHDRNRA